MSAEQDAKIEAAARECLAKCRTTDRPFHQVAEFIKSLEDDPNWTDKEIIELQTRVIRVLMVGGV